MPPGGLPRPSSLKKTLAMRKIDLSFFGTGCIDTASQVRKEVQFQDEVMKY